jgi:co-chaperonin GroES (HSP10)
MLKVKPANPKLLVEPMGVEVKTESGLFLPGKVFGQDLALAKVLSISPAVEELNDKHLAKGRIVLVNTHCGFEITYQEKTMKLITVPDIHAYVELDGEDDLVPETPLPLDYQTSED